MTVIVTEKEKEAIKKICETARAEWEHFIVKDLADSAAECQLVPLYYFSAWRRSRLSCNYVQEYKNLLAFELGYEEDERLHFDIDFVLTERLAMTMKELRKKYEDYVLKISL